MTNKILFFDFPPFSLENGELYNHSGVNYLRGYLNNYNIPSDLYSLKDGYIENKMKLNKITHIKKYEKILESAEYRIILEDHVNNVLMNHNLKDYKTLGFSIFANFSAYIFFEFFEILKNAVDISNHEIIIGGNYLKTLDNGEQFRSYTDNICTGEAEDFFNMYFNLDASNYFEYNQYIDPTEIDVYKQKDNMPLSIFISKSCVNKCNYCINTLRNSVIRYRNDDDVIREIMYFVHQGINSFYLDTENFGNNYKKINELTKKLKIFRGIGNCSFSYFTSFAIKSIHNKPIEYIDFKQLKDSGCGVLAIGLESLVSSVRDKMNKPNISNEDLFHSIREIVNHDIKILVNLITCYYNETEEEFNQNCLIMKEFFEEFKEDIIGVRQNYFSIYEFEMLGKFPNGDEITYDENGNWYYKNNNFEKRNVQWREVCHMINDFQFGSIFRDKKINCEDDMGII